MWWRVQTGARSHGHAGGERARWEPLREADEEVADLRARGARVAGRGGGVRGAWGGPLARLAFRLTARANWRRHAPTRRVTRASTALSPDPTQPPTAQLATLWGGGGVMQPCKSREVDV